MPTNCPGCRRPIAGDEEWRRYALHGTSKHCPEKLSPPEPCECEHLCWLAGTCVPPEGWPARVAELEKENARYRDLLDRFVLIGNIQAPPAMSDLGSHGADAILAGIEGQFGRLAELERDVRVALSPAGEGGGRG